MPITDEQAAEVRRLLYHEYQESKRNAFQLNGDYGKWLIGSLLLVHGATIAFLAQSERLSNTVLPVVFWWHTTGLLMAFACGFATWINWSLHALLYQRISARMIYEDEHWPTFDGAAFDWIGRTHWIAIAAGILSWLCIVGSAATVYSRM